MSRYPAYAEYVDSGVAWLGHIPAHWEVKRLKLIALVQPSNVDKKSLDDEEPVLLCNYTDVYKNDFIDSSIEFMQATATQSEINKFLLAADDIILTKDSESPHDIAVPAYVAESFQNVLCGYHLTHIRPVAIYGKYLFRLFQSTQFNGQFVVGANGVTRFGLPQDVIDNALISIPPLPEQQVIARFLDYKTIQTNALIAKREALLTKLAEKRIALISQVVARGLDPTAPLKDSGVEWLGEIPAHWDVSRLAYVADSLQTGPFGSQLHSEEYIEGGIPVINPADISNGELHCNPHITVSEEVAERLARHRLQHGDIVIGRRGEMGRAGIVKSENTGWICGTGSLRARLDQSKLDPRYFLNQFILQGVADYLSLHSVGSTMDNLNTAILGRLPVLLPPLPEQKIIIDLVHAIHKRMSQMETKIRQAIHRLEEYRTALITSAVTGTIDVRDILIPERA